MASRLYILLFIFTIASCKKDNIDTNNYGDIVKTYAPFKVGSELYYKVDSTFYDDFKDTSFTHTIYRKCVIDSLDNTIQGRTLFRVVVSETIDTSLAWKHVRVDQWAITEQYFETQTENIRFTHLIFPLNYESVWNVNQYNNKQEQFRYYFELNDTFKTNSFLFTDVVKVENEPRQNAVVDISYYEVFAKNIGCVYKKITNIETQFGKPNGYEIINQLYAYQL